MADDGNKKKDTRRKRRKVESDTDAGIHVLFSPSAVQHLFHRKKVNFVSLL